MTEKYSWKKEKVRWYDNFSKKVDLSISTVAYLLYNNERKMNVAIIIVNPNTGEFKFDDKYYKTLDKAKKALYKELENYEGLKYD